MGVKGYKYRNGLWLKRCIVSVEMYPHQSSDSVQVCYLSVNMTQTVITKTIVIKHVVAFPDYDWLSHVQTCCKTLYRQTPGTASGQYYCAKLIVPKCDHLLLSLMYWVGQAWRSDGNLGQRRKIK